MFLFPTVAHCGGGYADSSFDLVYPMVQWVEGGTAPSQIVATDTVNSTTLTRPVYPYPLVPKYNGSGPTTDGVELPPGRLAARPRLLAMDRQRSLLPARGRVAGLARGN